VKTLVENFRHDSNGYLVFLVVEEERKESELNQTYETKVKEEKAEVKTEPGIKREKSTKKGKSSAKIKLEPQTPEPDVKVPRKEKSIKRLRLNPPSQPKSQVSLLGL